jgi:hypothetical protein
LSKSRWVCLYLLSRCSPLVQGGNLGGSTVAWAVAGCVCVNVCVRGGGEQELMDGEPWQQGEACQLMRRTWKLTCTQPRATHTHTHHTTPLHPTTPHPIHPPAHPAAPREPDPRTHRRWCMWANTPRGTGSWAQRRRGWSSGRWAPVAPHGGWWTCTVRWTTAPACHLEGAHTQHVVRVGWAGGTHDEYAPNEARFLPTQGTPLTNPNKPLITHAPQSNPKPRHSDINTHTPSTLKAGKPHPLPALPPTTTSIRLHPGPTCSPPHTHSP